MNNPNTHRKELELSDNEKALWDKTNLTTDRPIILL
jgi:hypothetical protein